MPEATCLLCKNRLDVSDDVAECPACGAVMKVSGWKPFQLELVGSQTVDQNSADQAIVEYATEEPFDRYRTGGRRFVAGLIDGLVLLPIDWVARWVLDSDQPFILVAIALLVRYESAWVYSVLMHGFRGQTVGKMLCGVKVLDLSEQPITIKQAFLRDSVVIAIDTISLVFGFYYFYLDVDINSRVFISLAWILTFAAFLWFIGEMLTLLTNEKRRAIHDFIAGTVVIKTTN